MQIVSEIEKRGVAFEHTADMGTPAMSFRTVTPLFGRYVFVGDE